MTGKLLWRGMLAGILAALLATLFARVYAEPQVDRAIAFEASHEAQDIGAGGGGAHHHDDEEGPPPVSRETQKSFGLATAVILYGAAVGGLFALVFAGCHGRIGRIGPRALALLLGALAFAVIVIVPGLKYPPNPPAVGQPDTIQLRTAAYFAMIAVSIVALVVATRVRSMLTPRIGAFDGLVAGAGAYALVVLLAQAALPAIDEVPADFPAALLWRFRVDAIAMQFLLWSALALGFGWMAERCLRASRAPGLRPH